MNPLALPRGILTASLFRVTFRIGNRVQDPIVLHAADVGDADALTYLAARELGAAPSDEVVTLTVQEIPLSRLEAF